MIHRFQKENIEVLQFNRPKVNALNKELIESLIFNLDEIVKDDNIKGIILTGQKGFFSAGLDIVELYNKDKEYMKSFWKLFSSLLEKIYTYPKIIFSAISGHSPAGGTVISIMTDYRIMSKGNFLIGLNEVAVGLSVPIGICRIFQSLLGERVAEKMILQGELVNPEKAATIGLVDKIIDQNKLLDHSITIMHQWLKLPFQKQIQSKLTLRKNASDLIIANSKSDNDEVIDAWFSDECKFTMGKIIENLLKK